MSDAYIPDPECPNCSETIDEGSETCPHCEAELITCDRCGCLVTKDDYKCDVSMCENCWHDTVKQ